jgi:hypothetical protein
MTKPEEELETVKRLLIIAEAIGSERHVEMYKLQIENLTNKIRINKLKLLNK